MKFNTILQKYTYQGVGIKPKTLTKPYQVGDIYTAINIIDRQVYLHFERKAYFPESDSIFMMHEYSMDDEIESRVLSVYISDYRNIEYAKFEFPWDDGNLI